MAYKEMGYLPEALVNYLVRLGWSHGDDEIFTRDDLIQKFRLENVGRSAGVFSPDKLVWLNTHYIKESTPERLAELATPYLEQKGYHVADPAYLARACLSQRHRIKTIAELADELVFFIVKDEDLVYDSKAAAKFLKADMAPVMADLIARFEELDDFSEHAIEQAFTAAVEAHHVKLGKIAQPTRVALTGTSASPGIFEVIDILGKDHVLARLRRAHSFMEQSGAGQ